MTLFVASFVYVALKALQQLNVVGRHFIGVAPCSLGMAICEAFTIYTVAQEFSAANVLAVASGATLGCWLAMWAHPLMVRGRHEKAHA